MTRRVVFMAPEHLRDSECKTSALESNALAQLLGNGDLIDLHDVNHADQSWGEWWRDMLPGAGDVVLVLVPDAGGILGFRQHQRADYARKLGVPVYALLESDESWMLRPISETSIRPCEPPSLARFMQVKAAGVIRSDPARLTGGQ